MSVKHGEGQKRLSLVDKRNRIIQGPLLKASYFRMVVIVLAAVAGLGRVEEGAFGTNV